MLREISTEVTAATWSHDHRPFLLPEMFSGDKIFEEWTYHFESMRRYFGIKRESSHCI